ncbi:MAG: hypothetical protein ACT4NV_01210 [Rhodoferax sp.]
MFKNKWLVRGAVVVAALMVAAALAGAMAWSVIGTLRAAAPTVRPFSAAQIDERHRGKDLTDCFWVGTLHADTFNILSPDLGVTYWTSQFKLPAGAHLELQGQYPHARYMSYTSYNPVGQPVDGLADAAIAPDSGSTNPFLPGAQRASTQRRYTLTVRPRMLQAGARVEEATRPANTVFVPMDETNYQLWLRVYVPDQGTGPKGGVALPAPTVVLADGRRISAEAVCRDYVVKDGAVRDFRGTPQGNQGLFKIPGARAAYHPAQPAPVPWNAFYNPPLVVAGALVNTPFEFIRNRMDTTRKAGFYSTLDNAYMSTYVDRRYGEALVVQAKAPRTPRTVQGSAVMDQDVDMRYWSYCKGRSIADGAVDACLYDEQIVQDAQGRYTLVMTTPEQRPANARAECGVSWMPWGVGDGMDNPHGGYLIHRHQMPAPGFRHSLAATRKIGDEPAVLGDYFPRAQYETKAAFEARGCPVRP